MRRYNRRPFPGQYDKGFLDLEAAHVEQAILDAQAGSSSGVTPGTYGDATHVPQVTVDANGRVTAASNVAIVGGGGSSLMIAADVSTSAADVSTGLSFAVVSGKTYTVRGTLFLADTSANGLIIKLAHPTVSSLILWARGTTTSVSVLADTAITTTTTSPLSTSSGWNKYIGTGWGTFEVTFVATASGTFDVQLSRITSGTATAKAGSFIEWWSN